MTLPFKPTPCLAVSRRLKVLASIGCAALALSLAPCASFAQPAASAAKPAAKEVAAPVASPAKPGRNPSPKSAGAKRTEYLVPAANAEQIDAAKQVYYGAYDCEFKQSVRITEDPTHLAYVRVTHGKASYLMKPVISSTGAVRLEDVRDQTLMVQISSKSMLLNVRTGQRVVDECVTPRQRELIEAARAAKAEAAVKAEAALSAAAAASMAAPTPTSAPAPTPATPAAPTPAAATPSGAAQSVTTPVPLPTAPSPATPPVPVR